MEEDHAPDDGDSVGEQRRDSGCREGSPALEAELKKDECESVSSKQRWDESEPRASGDGSLRADVARRIEEARPDSETSPRYQAGPEGA